MATVEMNWLGSRPGTSGAVTSGICWPRGAMSTCLEDLNKGESTP
jgi:hypothetical protein